MRKVTKHILSDYHCPRCGEVTTAHPLPIGARIVCFTCAQKLPPWADDSEAAFDAYPDMELPKRSDR
jgi:hypothetical protein